MSALTFAMPVLPGKSDAYKSFIKALGGEKKEEFTALAKKGGLDHVRAWLQSTPTGDLAIIVHEGPNPDQWMPTMMASDEPIAQWFRDQISELHGMDTKAPPPPTPELVFDYSV